MKKLFLAAALLLATAASAQTVQINGAGATFPSPIYTKWFDQYHKAHPNAEINYQPIGSGGGIRQLSAGTVFFGASDGPMTNDQITGAGFRILHLPTVLGGVVPIYNIPEVKAELRFPGKVLADIYLGKITRWNDSAIQAANPGVSLPGSEITVVHRSDGSGTSYIWCDYLSKVSPEYRKTVGVATSVNWPAGVGAKGNEGVAGLVKQTPSSIGYVELIFALQNKMSYGTVQSQAGEFVRASTETVTNAAAEAVKNMPKDFRVSITNAPGRNVYPISSFTWLLLQQSPRDVVRSRMMVEFARWALTDGQQYAAPLGYAPLPKEIVAMEMEALKQVKQ
ncbi:MAG TPA: phosphate ABC transporter substrate-binding protein PstS [Thermoanaerobaculia bacterium]|nr:phosphate ABC transporter substrate-binding protein PstS [Thermoanaerobaculia bacterium]